VTLLDAPIEVTRGLQKNDRSLPLPAGPQYTGAYFADGLVTVDRAKSVVYFVKANAFESYPDLLVGVNAADGAIVAETPLTLGGFPLSGVHLDQADGSLVGFGLKSDDEGWHFSAGRFDLTASPSPYTELVVYSADVEPFVEYTWSDYDTKAKVLYVFSRHEDDPIALPAQLFSFDLANKKVSVVNVSLDFIYSSFFIDSRAPNTLLAFSPGPVDSSGEVPTVIWQVVKIDATTGSVVSVAKAPTSVNAYPVWWGGGVSGFGNSKAAPAADNISLHFLSPHGPQHPHPSELIGLAFDLRTNVITVLGAPPSQQPFPYLFNMVLVG